MIDSEAAIFVANDAMAEIIKAKSAKAKLVRVAATEGFYEVRLTLNGKSLVFESHFAPYLAFTAQMQVLYW